MDFYINIEQRTIDGVTVYPNNYVHSHIRTWLQDTFYEQAFTLDEKNQIVYTNYSQDTPSSVVPDTNLTSGDKVFLLTIEDVLNADLGFFDNASRSFSTTNYANAQGSNLYNMWLRTTGSYEVTGFTLNFDGTYDEDLTSVNNTAVGVLPAIWVNLAPNQGDTVELGMYPQSEVTNTVIKDALTGLAGPLPTEADAKAWTDYGFYISGAIKSYTWYIDVNYIGEQYRGVYFTINRPQLTTGGSDSWSVQYGNGYLINNVYWFKWEPINWMVHKTSGNKVLMSSNLILDATHFYNNLDNRINNDEEIKPNNYTHSDIRSWLQNTFYEQAFTEVEKNKILFTNYENDGSSAVAPDNLTSGDKVFLLSKDDIYNAELGFVDDNARVRDASKYASALGLGYNNWWVRTGSNSFDTDVYYSDDKGDASYEIFVTMTANGVVPAMWITL